jgi:hypothetical protein
MRLFGRKLEGFAKTLVVLVAVLIVSSGLCGLQLLVANSYSSGSGEVLIALGIAELIAMLVSAVGIVLLLLAWCARAVLGRSSGSQSTQGANSNGEKVSQP